MRQSYSSTSRRYRRCPCRDSERVPLQLRRCTGRLEQSAPVRHKPHRLPRTPSRPHQPVHPSFPPPIRPTSRRIRRPLFSLSRGPLPLPLPRRPARKTAKRVGMFSQGRLGEPRVLEGLLRRDPPARVVDEEAREEVLPVCCEEGEGGAKRAVWLYRAEAAGAEELAGAA